MPELHGGCRTVCTNNRKLNSNLISPLNFLNQLNGSQIRAFLSVTSEPIVGGRGGVDQNVSNISEIQECMNYPMGRGGVLFPF